MSGRSPPLYCVCVCVCVFIKLHITAQSGLVILVILCPSHRSSQGGINDTCYENPDQTRQRGHTLSTCTNLTCVCVCVCVFSSHPFWTSSSLDIPAGVTQEEGHTGFLIHLLSAVRALIFLARRIQPFLSLVDREVEFCVLTI